SASRSRHPGSGAMGPTPKAQSPKESGVWLLLIAYACSGASGLIYEVTWTRLLTLHIGQSTAATSAVVAAFLGGLGSGSFLGGLAGRHLTGRQALYWYLVLEAIVALTAVVLPFEVRSLM